TDARSLARVYGSCVSTVDGIRLLSDKTVARATTEESSGTDAVLGVPTRLGLGFWIPSAMAPMLGPSSFGHPGAGGSVGFADREARVGFGYVMNKMGNIPMGDPRKRPLIAAVCQALG